MKKIALTVTLLLIGSLGYAADVKTFGDPLEGIDAVNLADVLAQPENGKAVRLEGTVEKVCQNMGCWIELKQGDSTIHVAMKGHSFGLPKDSAGRKVVLEGKVVVAEPDADQVEHLQSEGAGEAAASDISIEASGVELH